MPPSVFVSRNFSVNLIVPLFQRFDGSLPWCRNLGVMATADKLCLPEYLNDGDAGSWFKRFELCAAANEWRNSKMLLQLPTLFKGRAFAKFESLGDDDKDTYGNLKKAMTERLNPDTDENRMVAREQLRLGGFREGGKSVDDLAPYLERILDKLSPGLPAEIRETKLRFYLINLLSDKVAFQLKLSAVMLRPFQKLESLY